MTRAVWLALALAACGGKKEAPAGKSPAAPPATAGSASAPPAAGSAAPGSAAGSAGATTSAPRDKGPMPPAYREALARGRKQTSDKQYVEAAASFRAALAAVPDDPRALSELSWALFLGKELAAAREAAEAGVKLGRNNVKAASLYNLGRILEAQGAVPEAANAYRESLALRPNATVAARLGKLDPTAPAHADSLEIEEWGPPLATRPATCADLGEHPELEAWSPDGACEVTVTEVALTGGGPFAQVVQLGRKRSGSDEAFLAVRTAGGWLLSPPFLDWGGVGTWGGSAKVVRAEVVQHAVLGPLLRVDVHTSESGRWESWDTDATVVCQAPAASGALTCTPLLATGWVHSMDEDAGDDESCSASLAIAADGAIVVTATGGKVPTDCPIRTGTSRWPRAR